MDEPGRVGRLVLQLLSRHVGSKLVTAWASIAPSSLLTPLGLLSSIRSYLASYVIICSLTGGIDVDTVVNNQFNQSRAP
jgi:hypothetical protein